MGEIVFPGSFLCTEEEFLPDENVFVDEKGNINSFLVGEKQVDLKEKKVIVSRNNSKISLNKGAIVFGRVMMAKEKMLILHLFQAEKDGKKISVQGSAALFIFEVSNSFVDSLKDVARLGDYVKAKVVEVSRQGIDLSIKEPFLGVVKAYCIKCRSPLKLEEKTLKCVECGNIEKRKISNDYIVK
ncbi:MAG: exosome complex RNA-binding protein Csl4 [Candidatus Diapherotrites archaeon]